MWYILLCIDREVYASHFPVVGYLDFLIFPPTIKLNEHLYTYIFTNFVRKSPKMESLGQRTYLFLILIVMPDYFSVRV